MIKIDDSRLNFNRYPICDIIAWSVVMGVTNKIRSSKFKILNLDFDI
jgi:hypothetical protein